MNIETTGDIFKPLTRDEIKKLAERMKAAEIKRAPKDLHSFLWRSGLTIVKNEYLPSNVIAVDEHLFDALYADIEKESPQQPTHKG